MKCWRYLLLSSLIVLTTLTPLQWANAQTPLDLVLQRVKAYMQEQIGRDFVIVEWTYVVETWENAGLGCPAPGVSYVDEDTQGYNFSITIDGDETFEVHSNLAGTVVNICTPIDRSVLIDYRTFQDTGFVIDYPETWQTETTAPEFVVAFYPGGETNCETPGMTIRLVEQSGANANILINDMVRQEGFVQSLGVAVPVGEAGGQTITYQVACDAALQAVRTTAFLLPDLSGGYVVRQWANVAEFNGWDGSYLTIIDSFSLINDIIANNGTTENGDTADATELLSGFALAHSFVDQLYVSALDDLPGIQITTTTAHRRSFAFSRNGQYLAYIEPNPRMGGERLEGLQVGGRTRAISPSVAPNFPVSWAWQEDTIVFVAPSEAEGFEIHTVSATGDNDMVLGTFPFPADCELPSTPYIPETLYWAEAGINGSGYTFEWLPDGRFLLTSNCAGTELAFWTPESGIEALGEYRNAALSFNGLRLAVLDADENIVIFDLTNGNQQVIELESTPDQLAWNDDGSLLYYTVIEELDTITVDDQGFAERGRRILGIYPYESVLNSASIFALNTVTQESNLLWTQQGYAVGRLEPLANGVGMFFSFIPDDRQYIDGFRQNLIYRELRFRRPETRIYWLPPNGGEAQLLVISQQPVPSPVVVNPQ